MMDSRNLRVIRKAFFVGFFILSITSDPVFAQGFSYQWGHPSPQGNAVYGLAFQDVNTGWAVTGCGNILKTTDSGVNWAIILHNGGLCRDLYDLLISSQGTLIVSGDQGTILRSVDDGVNWSNQTIADAGRLYDLSAIPGGGISAAGQNGAVVVSFDDGITWANHGPGGAGYARHHFWKSALEAFVVGSDMFFRTTDGGETWNQVEETSMFGLNEVYFVNEDTGYAVEDFGYWKTVDGGEHWVLVQQFSGINYRYRTMPIDEQHWMAVTSSEGSELWETFDAGENWSMVYDRGSTSFFCISPIGEKIFLGTEIGDILFTDDLGINVMNGVENLAVFPVAPITVIGKRPDGTLFANNQPNSGTNNGTFFRSDDHGLNWYIPAEHPGLRWITDIVFFNDQYGVLGSYEDIRYTSDGGNTWEDAETGLPANSYLVNFSIPAEDRFFAGAYTISSGGTGNLYKSSDHGVTWQVVGGGLPVNDLYLACVSFADENHGYVSRFNGGIPDFYKTRDGGLSWTHVSQSGIPGFITDMCWFDENIGLVAVPGSEPGIFRTVDGGQHWTMVSETRARKFSKGAGNRVAALEPGNQIFQESFDGGITWTAWSPPFAAGFPLGNGSVTAVQSMDNGYVLGGDSNRLMVATDSTTTGIVEENGNHKDLQSGILAVTPNPLSGSGILLINLNKSGLITVLAADATGRYICTLFNKNLPSGIHEIQLDGEEFKKKLSSGVCFLTLVTEDSFDTEKIILLK